MKIVILILSSILLAGCFPAMPVSDHKKVHCQNGMTYEGAVVFDYPEYIIYSTKPGEIVRETHVYMTACFLEKS